MPCLGCCLGSHQGATWHTLEGRMVHRVGFRRLGGADLLIAGHGAEGIARCEVDGFCSFSGLLDVNFKGEHLLIFCNSETLNWLEMIE